MNVDIQAIQEDYLADRISTLLDEETQNTDEFEPTHVAELLNT